MMSGCRNKKYWIGLMTNSTYSVTQCGCKSEHTENSFCRVNRTHNACCECRSPWYWVDGNDVTYVNWIINEPTGEQTCARISPHTTANELSNDSVTAGFYWYDSACTDSLRFICKALQGKCFYTRRHVVCPFALQTKKKKLTI